MEQNKSNTRQYPRLERIQLIAYSHYDTQGILTTTGRMGTTLNLSLGGALIEIANEFPVGTIIVLDLNISGKIIRIKGKIIHVRKTDSQLWSTGIQIIDIKPEEREVLSRFLEEKS